MQSKVDESSQVINPTSEVSDVNVNTPSDTSSSASSVSTAVSNVTPSEKKLSKTQEKKNRRQNKSFTKRFIDMLQKNNEQRIKLENKIERLRMALGKEEFAALKTIATVPVPEQKNDKGEITQEATTTINYGLLFYEGQNVLAIMKEGRIKAGTRKRTTGRSSRRKAHRARLKFINERNAQLTALANAKPAAESQKSEEAQIS